MKHLNQNIFEFVSKVQYPGSNDNGNTWYPCDNYDPRRRPWVIQITEVEAEYEVYIDFYVLRRDFILNGMKQRYVAEKLLSLFIGDQGLTVVEGLGYSMFYQFRLTIFKTCCNLSVKELKSA